MLTKILRADLVQICSCIFVIFIIIPDLQCAVHNASSWWGVAEPTAAQ